MVKGERAGQMTAGGRGTDYKIWRKQSSGFLRGVNQGEEHTGGYLQWRTVLMNTPYREVR
jgi:hypothetical protein